MVALLEINDDRINTATVAMPPKRVESLLDPRNEFIASMYQLRRYEQFCVVPGQQLPLGVFYKYQIGFNVHDISLTPQSISFILCTINVCVRSSHIDLQRQP